jgi:hypothetical protein
MHTIRKEHLKYATSNTIKNTNQYKAYKLVY